MTKKRARIAFAIGLAVDAALLAGALALIAKTAWPPAAKAVAAAAAAAFIAYDIDYGTKRLKEALR